MGAEICKTCTAMILENPSIADKRYDLRIESKMNYDTEQQEPKNGRKATKPLPASAGQRPKTMLQCVDSRVERIGRRLQKVERS